MRLLWAALPILLIAAAAEAQQETTAGPVATAPQSVKPGINEAFLDPQLNVQEWIERFEVESREVFAARDEIIRQLQLRPDDRVADVGAGTGLFTLPISEAVGPSGWCYAIDISPKFVEHLAKLLGEHAVENVTPVICDDDSICLPPESIDLAYLCDVYHHFEYPSESMKSIHRALVPGGRVVVIDFERIPGVSREWTMGHVRAGKQTFIDEIEAAGFKLVAERRIGGFQENYFLEFRKPELP